jgi:hypothetical protein
MLPRPIGLIVNVRIRGKRVRHSSVGSGRELALQPSDGSIPRGALRELPATMP